MCRYRVRDLDRLPLRGPAILAMNHINFIELPLLYMKFKPRRILALTKTETWGSPVFRVLANLWEALPLRRGGVDKRAFATAAAEMERGALIGIAPEGTRSRDGKLRKGSAGIVMLAAHTGAPVYPLAQWGGENLVPALKRFRRALIRVRIGKPISIDMTQHSYESPRAVRARELRRIMMAIAEMLPPEYRGYYGDSPKIGASLSDNK